MFINLSVQRFNNKSVLHLVFQLLIVIYRRGILCIVVWDVNQFIGHCLIPGLTKPKSICHQYLDFQLSWSNLWSNLNMKEAAYSELAAARLASRGSIF